MTSNLTEKELIEIKKAAEQILKVVDVKLGPKIDPIELIPSDEWITVKQFTIDSGLGTHKGKKFVKNLYSLGKIEVQESTLKPSGIVVDTKIRRKEEIPLKGETLSFYNFVKAFQKVGFKDIPFGNRVKIELLEKKLLAETPWLNKSQFQVFLKDLHMLFPRKVTLEPSFDPYEKSIEISGEKYATIVLHDKLI